MSDSGAIAPAITCIPNINTEKPIRIVPIFFLLFVFAAIIIITPTKARIGVKDSGFKSLRNIFDASSPVKLKIQAVIVVPTLAPIITPTVCDKLIIPEFTRPTSITVTAEDDWITAVIKAPNAKLFNGLDVIFFKTCSNFPPASFSKPTDISDIPYRKNAKPPHNVSIEKISINFPSSS